MSTLRENLLDLSDVAGSRLLARVQGLTDDEYFWEPVPEVWTVRLSEFGPRIDGSAFPPEPPPFTTLARSPSTTAPRSHSTSWTS